MWCSEWCLTQISISQNHVSQVIKSTRVHARDLYRIYPLLDNTSMLLANALVSSNLDYCNLLLLSLTDFELRRLQLVQNSLCRVVIRSSKFSHITLQLKKLHWLPVRYRVQFKIGLITYKILNQGQPDYLIELIHPYISSRNTRQRTPKLKFLQTPTFDRRVHKSIKHFSNSFSHYAPVLWNSLARGGGVGFFINKAIQFRSVDTPTFSSFENISIAIGSAAQPLVLTCVYRPPGSCSNSFLDQFLNVLEYLSSVSPSFLICGDLIFMWILLQMIVLNSRTV